LLGFLQWMEAGAAVAATDEGNFVHVTPHSWKSATIADR
jgi:hypothetical protein